MLYTGNRIGSSNLPLSVQVIRVSCASSEMSSPRTTM